MILSNIGKVMKLVQSRSDIVQVDAIIGLMRLYDVHLNCEFPLSAEGLSVVPVEDILPQVQEMRNKIRIGLRTRFLVRYLQPQMYDLGLERCFLMSPKYKNLNVIYEFLQRNLFDSSLFLVIKQKIISGVLNLLENNIQHFQNASPEMLEKEGIPLEFWEQFNYANAGDLAQSQLLAYMNDTSVASNTVPPLEFWRQQRSMPLYTQYFHLSVVARTVFSLAASSAILENAFTTIQLLVPKNRTKLHHSFLSMRLMIKRAILDGKLPCNEDIACLSDEERNVVLNNFMIDFGDSYQWQMDARKSDKYL